MPETPSTEEPSADGTPPPRPRKWRRRFAFLGVGSGVFLCFALIGGGTAEYYTSRPEFCGSCHIMQPYYDSWHQDVHGSAGSATCVDCHYAPGQQHTFMAKFRGLSQLTSYFSGRAGAGRPKAQVSNASCTTSACHGDGKFMTTEQKIGDVTFSHARHLNPDDQMLFEKRSQLAELRSKLSETLSVDQITEFDTMARGMQPVDLRNNRLVAWITSINRDELRADVSTYGELLHMAVRVDQLAGLKCSSCHQFDSTLNQHFTAAGSTCFTCHFTNQPFNEGAGKCLGCHEPPTTVVPIHPGPQTSTATTTTPVMIGHATIVENNTDCASCHRDLIRGTGQVTQRDCQNCHDQQRYLADFATRTTDTVRAYHRDHAAGQRARCNDCHGVIEHRLTPMPAPTDALALLSPVRQDCQHCHADHHRPQVEMLLGRGGFVEGAQGVVNPMTGSRVNCRGCHTHAAEDSEQEVVVRSTLESCRACHSDDYKELFADWRQSIDARQMEATALLADARARLEAATGQKESKVAEASQLVVRASKNLRLVTSANGIHNRNYALMLLDQAIIDLEASLATLSE